MKISAYPWSSVLFCILIIVNGCHSDVLNEKVHSDIKWEKLGPGGGGAVFIPTFSYKSADNFLLRCDMTGSYLTNDGGSSYQQINLAGGASSYAWDPSDSNIVYIGSACLNRSQDGGKDWERIFPPKEEITSEQFIGDHADYSIKTTETSLYDNESGRIGAIRADPLNPGSVYFSMGRHFYYPDNSQLNGKENHLNNQLILSMPGNPLQKMKYIFSQNHQLSYSIKPLSIPCQKTSRMKCLRPSLLQAELKQAAEK